MPQAKNTDDVKRSPVKKGKKGGLNKLESMENLVVLLEKINVN